MYKTANAAQIYKVATLLKTATMNKEAFKVDFKGIKNLFDNNAIKNLFDRNARVQSKWQRDIVPLMDDIRRSLPQKAPSTPVKPDATVGEVSGSRLKKLKNGRVAVVGGFPTSNASPKHKYMRLTYPDGTVKVVDITNGLAAAQAKPASSRIKIREINAIKPSDRFPDPNIQKGTPGSNRSIKDTDWQKVYNRLFDFMHANDELNPEYKEQIKQLLRQMEDEGKAKDPFFSNLFNGYTIPGSFLTAGVGYGLGSAASPFDNIQS